MTRKFSGLEKKERRANGVRQTADVLIEGAKGVRLRCKRRGEKKEKNERTNERTNEALNCAKFANLHQVICVRSAAKSGGGCVCWPARLFTRPVGRRRPPWRDGSCVWRAEAKQIIFIIARGAILFLCGREKEKDLIFAVPNKVESAHEEEPSVLASSSCCV